MDAKYNWLIDNGAIRVTLNVVALACAGGVRDGFGDKDQLKAQD